MLLTISISDAKKQEKKYIVISTLRFSRIILSNTLMASFDIAAYLQEVGLIKNSRGQ